MQSAQQTGAGQTLAESFKAVRDRTIELCRPLEKEDFVLQPCEDVSPARWNIAHTTWFFEEMILKNFAPGYREFNPAYTFLFNSYYNTVGERTERHQRGDLSRPTVEEIFEYRIHVDEAMSSLLASLPAKEVCELTVLGINHEQQHQELFLTDLKYSFSLNPVKPVYRDDFALVEAVYKPEKGRLTIKEGSHEIGYPGNGFCFDNELSRHKVFLNEFSIDLGLVTNSEYLEFVENKGYQDHRLWHSDGWEWVQTNDISAPLYWQKGLDGSWSNYTLAGMRDIALDAPVCHVSFYEAAAYAEWKNRRLPTEFEWEAANELFQWGTRWEWTNSAYLPYPGFRTAEGAVGEYNGKFMVNQMVLRGASCATPAGHSRSSYRNFFQPHLRWQYTGIRLAR